MRTTFWRRETAAPLGSSYYRWRLTTSLCTSSKKYGIAKWFNEIRGRTRPDQEKPMMLAELIMQRSLNPTRVVHIGDSLEDAAAASAVGAISVLVTGASLQPPDRVMLKQLQPFVASSLKQALQYAGGDGD